MVSVSFNARERRLVLDGSCRVTDAEGVADAIRTAADPARGLVLDLTRLTGIPHEVAIATVAACCAAEAEGCRVRVWTLPGSATELALGAASRGQSALATS